MAAHVYANVWISDEHTARDATFIQEQKIGLIVDCRDRSADNDPNIITTVERYRIRLRDDPTPLRNTWSQLKLFKKLTLAAANIQRAVEQGKAVLVHCVAGINRSALVLAWWLRIVYNITPSEAYGMLECANMKRRLPALTNEWFRIVITVDVNGPQTP